MPICDFEDSGGSGRPGLLAKLGLPIPPGFTLTPPFDFPVLSQAVHRLRSKLQSPPVLSITGQSASNLPGTSQVVVYLGWSSNPDRHLQYKLQYQALVGQELPRDGNVNDELGKICQAMFVKGAVQIQVQHMVFGDQDSSCVGMACSRHPKTGENKLWGEYYSAGKQVLELETMHSAMYHQLVQLSKQLEAGFNQAQEFQFTIERGTLFLTHTCAMRMPIKAAVKVAVNMCQAGMISPSQAVMHVDVKSLDQLLHKQLEGQSQAKLLARGMPASPGAAVGVVAFSSKDAFALRRSGSKLPIVLVRSETAPEDVTAMQIVSGLLVQRGGMTSHAAVLARGLGKCCITGCEAVQVLEGEGAVVGGVLVKVGDWLTLDGSTGEVFQGKLLTRDAVLDDDYFALMEWADGIRSLKVRTNADTPKDAQRALDFGCEGIGLVRTEHMFFQPQRLVWMRRMILAQGDEENNAARKLALEKLSGFQQEDFEQLFKVMSGLPVVIRLLDPPLHEFLPHTPGEVAALAQQIPGATVASIERQMEQLKETNPMLGFRGCRLGVVFPDIYEMQLRAIYLAATKAKMELGLVPIPEVEVPLVGHVQEFLPIRNVAREIHKQVGALACGVPFRVGAMVEVPRAALEADLLAQTCDFLSFGTNDLTQMSLGFSRDDASKFLPSYVRKGIYPRDPFASIDQQGVGKVMQLCVSLARKVNPVLDIGICGEQGGEPESIEFAHKIGLSNVSCSPFRVPIARLAAAQARIKFGPQPQTLDLLGIFDRNTTARL
ncbi:pyruvate, phosphate dikinase [Batrachochytrium salamandrivorans]|nr:pyruvate, phosphate dikinase [Batrachochytrium salamandrivorans]